MTKEWDMWKETILDLYKVQGKTLTETLKMMDEKHGFKASTRAYRSRLKKWNVGKYNMQARRDSAPAGPVVLHQATAPVVMTQSVSYPGTSAAGPVRARSATNSSHTWLPYSPDLTVAQVKPDLYESSDSPSSVASSQNPAHQQYRYYVLPRQQPHHHLDFHHDHVHNLPGQQQGTDFPVPGGGQGRQLPLRPLLPAVQPQQWVYNTGPDVGNDCLNTLYTLLSPHSPPSSPSEAEERIHLVSRSVQHLAELGRLDERLFGGNGPTAFEWWVQAFVSQGFPSRDIRLFYHLCATFVRHRADVGRLVPRGLEETVSMAVHSQRPDMIDEVLLRHQQQQQQQQHLYGGYGVPSWIPVWISACVQSLRGNGLVVDYHLSALRSIVGQDLKALLPEP